jgi:hypothetical protein
LVLLQLRKDDLLSWKLSEGNLVSIITKWTEFAFKITQWKRFGFNVTQWKRFGLNVTQWKRFGFNVTQVEEMEFWYLRGALYEKEDRKEEEPGGGRRSVGIVVEVEE